MFGMRLLLLILLAALRLPADGGAADGYVDAATCRSCHHRIYDEYQKTTMGRAFYLPDPEKMVEDWSESNSYYHEPSQRHYEMTRRGDKFYVRRYQLDAQGRRIHQLEKQVTHVMGSGARARSYIHQTSNGRMVELPISWYAQENSWGMAPGYDKPKHAGFTRIITNRCMFCHNGYPFSAMKADRPGWDHDPSFRGAIPMGIDCQRCHGPGEEHILEANNPTSLERVRKTITNPARLGAERQLDICMQCHLETPFRIPKSVRRFGRTVYSYRPGEALSDYIVHFDYEEGTGHEDDFLIVSAAYRLRKSACFQQSSELICTTCHDPHEAFRLAGPDYFNATCMTCHDTAALQAALPAEASRAVHTEDAHCFSCHMPKAAVEGTPHTSFTDHRIRVVREREADAASDAASGGEAPVERIRLRPYYAADDSTGAYAGMAYVIRGLQQQDTTALRHGVTLLGAAAGAFGEAQYLLGYGYMQLGEMERAAEPLEQAVALEPKPERLNALAQTYERVGREDAAIRDLYEQALATQPALASVRVNYGRYLETRGELAEAVAQYRAAIAEYPWLEAAHFNLGTARLRQGDRTSAERSLREAVRLNPDGGQALGNLGLLLAGSGRLEEARAFFEQAARAEPENPVAFGNLGALHLNEGRPDIAARLFSRAVELDPSYVDGLVNLALAWYLQGEDDRARMYAERALRLAPNHPQARQILDAV